MKQVIVYFVLLLLASCGFETQHKATLEEEPINEMLYVDLGGEAQYVEIVGVSKHNPILLFIHGGPAWPQTPQLRYYSSSLADHYTLVVWEQRGAGKSYIKNPQPDNLTLEQIVQDGHELTTWLRERFSQEKIYVAGYSWGSLVGLHLVNDHPSDYAAYIGIAQIVNMDKGIDITQSWLRKQATESKDYKALLSLDSLREVSYYEDDLDRFFQQWELLNKYNGATFNKASEEETEKAMSYYEDYQDYDWFKVWEYSSKKLQAGMFGSSMDHIKELDVPVFLLQGRHDWNIPSQLASEWLKELKAPRKELYWFEQSGHGPLEEEPAKFNETMANILIEMREYEN